MYHGQVPRTAPPEVRTALIERAAAMLAAREPVTLRTVVAGTGASTMAVYPSLSGSITEAARRLMHHDDLD